MQYYTNSQGSFFRVMFGTAITYYIVETTVTLTKSEAQQSGGSLPYKGWTLHISYNFTSHPEFFSHSHMPLSHPSESHIVGVHLLVTGNDSQLLALFSIEAADVYLGILGLSTIQQESYS